jgi:DNA-binding NarL/FixJ family response regulator
VLEGLAEVACARGKHERATRLFGAAKALRESIGAPLPPCERADYDHGVEIARAGLDERDFAASWAQGRAMTLKQAVEYTLDEPLPPTPSPAPVKEASAAVLTVPPVRLSAREAEVLKLVARGLTNARVAEELFISPRTVNRHLNSIYGKLGISSRAAATRFAVEHDLL